MLPSTRLVNWDDSPRSDFANRANVYFITPLIVPLEYLGVLLTTRVGPTVPVRALSARVLVLIYMMVHSNVNHWVV